MVSNEMVELVHMVNLAIEMEKQEGNSVPTHLGVLTMDPSGGGRVVTQFEAPKFWSELLEVTGVVPLDYSKLAEQILKGPGYSLFKALGMVPNEMLSKVRQAMGTELPDEIDDENEDI